MDVGFPILKPDRQEGVDQLADSTLVLIWDADLEAGELTPVFPYHPLKGFLRACGKGFADFRDDTDAVLQILLDNQSEENFPLSPTVEQKSAAELLPRMETKDAPFGTQTAENWKENIDWMYEQGLIERVPEVSEIMKDL